MKLLEKVQPKKISKRETKISVLAIHIMTITFYIAVSHTYTLFLEKSMQITMIGAGACEENILLDVPLWTVTVPNATSKEVKH